MQYRFKLLVIILTAVLSLGAAGCRQVSEDASGLSDAPVVIPASDTEENFSRTEEAEMAETETETTLSTDTAAETVTETSILSETKSANTEITEKFTEISEAKSEIAAKITQTSQTAVITLQYESPREITEKKAETILKTETQTVSESRTAGKPKEKSGYSALNFDEQKGFWITYLEYASILRNKSEKSFTEFVGKYFDNISDLGFNTVYVQVRAFGDAYYDSELFPAGEQFDGVIGTKNRFDALKIMVKCAHDRGISIHAWVNPMRTMTSSQIEKIDFSTYFNLGVRLLA